MKNASLPTFLILLSGIWGFYLLATGVGSLFKLEADFLSDGRSFAYHAGSALGVSVRVLTGLALLFFAWRRPAN